MGGALEELAAVAGVEDTGFGLVCARPSFVPGLMVTAAEGVLLERGPVGVCILVEASIASSTAPSIGSFALD